MWLWLLLTLAAPDVRYLALGDSFTIGTGSSEAQAFPSRLKGLLEKKGQTVKLLNPAVNGYSTQELIDDELPHIATFKPTLVTVAVGANDLVRGRGPDAYRKNLKTIFAALPRAARVIALPQPDWSQSPVAEAFGDPMELKARIGAYNAILQEEAKLAGARYLDLWPLMRRQADAKKVAPDGLHPSAAAHLEWAEALAKEL
ncbi:MAG: SGNH/GDSL hydrolase family protein [Myxococcaceae bacterium]|nr:SGNH/GDSL hydrolase family protein [Myxococcaceae bacterium]